MKDNRYERGTRAGNGGARKGKNERHGHRNARTRRTGATMTDEALERYYLNKYDR